MAATPAAPPYVAYSSCTQALVPLGQWQVVFASLQSLKAHVQEYPGCQSFDVFVRAEPDGMLIHCYTTWDTVEQLEVYLSRGYHFPRMLGDVADLEPEETILMEKVF
jgi:quinol monooxygenase YgiN